MIPSPAPTPVVVVQSSPAVPAAAAGNIPIIAANNDTLIDAKVLLSVPSCKLYSLDGHRRLLVEAPLAVIEVTESDTYMLLIGTYTIALSTDIPCLVVAPRNFVFPVPSIKDGACYGLVLPATIPHDDEEVLEIILEASTALRRADAAQHRPIATTAEENKRLSSPIAVVASPKTAAPVHSLPTAAAATPVIVGTPVIATPTAATVTSTPPAAAARVSLPPALPVATVLAPPVAAPPSRISSFFSRSSTSTPSTPSSSSSSSSSSSVISSTTTTTTTTTTVAAVRPNVPVVAMPVAAPVAIAAPVTDTNNNTSSSSTITVRSSSSSTVSTSSSNDGSSSSPSSSEGVMVVSVATVTQSPSGDRVANVTYQIGSGVEIGGRKLAQGIEYGGRAVGSFVRNSSRFIVSKISPNDQPTSVSASTRDRLSKLRVVSGAAVKVSKAVVQGALATVSHASARLSDAVGETAMARRLRENPSERVDALKDAGRKSIEAILIVYASLAAAGVLLLEDTKEATVHVVTHRYGAEMGNSVDNGLGVATDMGQTSLALRSVGVRSLARGTAVGVASEFLSTDEERAQMRTGAPVLDPMTAMNAMIAVNAVSQMAAPLFASTPAADGTVAPSPLAPLLTAAMPALLTVTSRPAPPPSIIAAQQQQQQQAAAAAAVAAQAIAAAAAPVAHQDVALD